MSEHVQTVSPPQGFYLWTVQIAAIRCTDCGIPTHILSSIAVEVTVRLVFSDLFGLSCQYHFHSSTNRCINWIGAYFESSL